MNKKILYIIIILITISCKSNQTLYEITNDTMSPIINPGDFVLVDSTVNTFTYGDIVIYAHKNDEKSEDFNGIFRIVALPGDNFATENEICIINQKKNKVRYIKDGSFFEEYEEELPNGLKIIILHYPLDNVKMDQDPIKIPRDHYFMLGDTRTGTLDSRYFGPIHKDRIAGKVIKVIKGDE